MADSNDRPAATRPSDATRDEEKKDALARLAALVERILDPPAGNIVELSTRA